MKAIFISILFLFGAISFSLASGNNDDAWYYNQHKHSDKVHAGMIAFAYKMFFDLSKKEYKYIRQSIIDIFEENKAILESKNDEERQTLEATFIHNMLVKEFKDMLPCSQYNIWLKSDRNIETLTAKGH